MSVAVANAKEQHVLRRDFKSGRWVDIAGEGKTCRVQVVKSSGGEYLLKIFPQGGQVHTHTHQQYIGRRREYLTALYWLTNALFVVQSTPVHV